jgi:Ca2+-binding EF-hand superfamily protein
MEDAAMEDLFRKIGRRLKAATPEGSSAQQLFLRADKDHVGTLAAADFLATVRNAFGVSKNEFSDEELLLLASLFDSDGTGALPIVDLVTFAEKGLGALKRDPEWTLRPVAQSPAAKARRQAKKMLEKAAVFQSLQDKLVTACGANANDGVELTAEQLWNKFDRSNDGIISTRELFNAVRGIMLIPKNELADTDVNALVEAVDTDGSGNLEIDQLVAFTELGLPALLR